MIMLHTTAECFVAADLLDGMGYLNKKNKKEFKYKFKKLWTYLVALVSHDVKCHCR